MQQLSAPGLPRCVNHSLTQDEVWRKTWTTSAGKLHVGSEGAAGVGVLLNEVLLAPPGRQAPSEPNPEPSAWRGTAALAWGMPGASATESGLGQRPDRDSRAARLGWAESGRGVLWSWGGRTGSLACFLFLLFPRPSQRCRVRQVKVSKTQKQTGKHPGAWNTWQIRWRDGESCGQDSLSHPAPRPAGRSQVRGTPRGVLKPPKRSAKKRLQLDFTHGWTGR